MKILALDASSPVTSICMVDFLENEKNMSPISKLAADKEQEVPTHTILCRYDEPHERCNSSVFFKGLETVIEQSGIPERLVIGLGPGSYNGLRSSIAAAQGIASALNIDLVGLPSPLAVLGPSSGFWICGDARGGDYWLAAVANSCFIEEPFLLPSAEVEGHLLEHPDFPLLSSTALKQLPSSLTIKTVTPDSLLLADRGKSLSASPTIPEPLYLKSPCITLKR